MNFKIRVLFFLILIFNINLLIAGCGGCQINNNSDIETSSSIYIESIPANGKIDGFDIVNNGKEQVKERFEIIDPNMPNVNKGTDIQQDDNNNNINLDNTQAYKYLRDIYNIHNGPNIIHNYNQ